MREAQNPIGRASEDKASIADFNYVDFSYLMMSMCRLASGKLRDNCVTSRDKIVYKHVARHAP